MYSVGVLVIASAIHFWAVLQIIATFYSTSNTLYQKITE
jgi:hypothetical protein